MRLCLIAPYPPPYGGIANWVLLIEQYLKNETDIELSIINTALGKRTTEGRTLWDRVVTNGFKMLGKRRELISIIKDNRPDAIHITTSGELAVIRDIFLLRTAKRYEIPAVYHIRFGRIPEIAGKNTREWKLISKAMRLASTVIAIDKTTLTAIKKHLPEVNAVYVPNPANISKLPKAGGIVEKSVMFLGWVVKTKGVEELLEAWEAVHKRHADWVLNIVGPYKQEYYHALGVKYSSDGVVFCGEKKHDEAMDLLNKSAIFILPSYTEGFPNSVLEAMALKKPIIATRVGAIPDMLSDGCGVLVQKGCVSDIAEALDALISENSARVVMGEKARKKLEDEYTIEKAIEQYRGYWDIT